MGAYTGLGEAIQMWNLRRRFLQRLFAAEPYEVSYLDGAENL